MQSTQRRCQREGCERKPEFGWARCREHNEEWLYRIFAPLGGAKKPERPIDELELRTMWGDR